MKIKTNLLAGAALDWAVAKSLGLDIQFDPMGFKTPQKPGGYWTMQPTNGQAIQGCDKHIGSDYSPSTIWEQGGPIIEREGITILRCDDDYGVDEDGFTTQVRIQVWAASDGHHSACSSTEHQSHDSMFQIYASDVAYGPIPLIAAMRRYVASKLGDDIEIPENLT